MKVDMLMPQMGESITEATISKWLKNVGDSIEKDEIVLEISTDKVDSEIPAPSAGVLSEVLFKEGDVVPVKSKIAIIDSEGSNGARAAEPATPPKEEKEAKPEKVEEKPEAAEASQAKTNGTSTSDSDRFYSPLVKSLAEKHGVALSELDSVKGTGQGGRVNKSDFLNYIDEKEKNGGTTAPAKKAPAQEARQDIDWGEDGSQVIPMNNMRQAIAEHMVRSKHTSPHVYSVQEVDMTAVSKWRARNKQKFTEKHGFNLSFTPFFLEAAVQALVKFPWVNSSVDGKKVILKKHVNLGCAVALGNSGLIVPVIKQAEEKNLVGLARGLNDLALRARDKKLMPDEVTGGTFTVTNPGVFGTMIGTPIINQPQVAILCLGAIKKRPVVIDDMIAIREVCYLTLSYDHRIVDGSLGGQFLAFIREYLEGWDSSRSVS